MNKKFVLIAILFLFSQNNWAVELMPSDVQVFIENRDACDHFRGEISGDPSIDESRGLYKQLEKYCGGTGVALASLRNKYKNNESI